MPIKLTKNDYKSIVSEIVRRARINESYDDVDSWSDDEREQDMRIFADAVKNDIKLSDADYVSNFTDPDNALKLMQSTNDCFAAAGDNDPLAIQLSQEVADYAQSMLDGMAAPTNEARILRIFNEATKRRR